MKKAKLLFIIFTCGLLAACGKNDNTDIESTELDISGVEVVQEQDDFEYAYTEKKDGSLIFTINGKWANKQKWSIVSDEEAIATVKEASQTNKKVVYHFTAQKGLNGYSEYAITLSDTETNKSAYTIMISVIADTDEKLSVLNIYGYVPSEEKMEVESEEADTEENTEANPTTEDQDKEESYTEEELQDINNKESEFDAFVGDVFIPEEFAVSGKKTDTFQEKEMGRMNIQYKENIFTCTIIPSLSVSEIKKQINSETKAWKTKKIGKTEVYYCELENDTIVVWTNKEGISFTLSGRDVESDITFEAVGLMLGNK